MRRNKEKGFTLTEICVALAVLSIISAAVVSFTAMATGRGATGTDKLKFMQDIELLETTVEDWFQAVYTGKGSVEAVTEPTDPTAPTDPTDPTAPTDPADPTDPAEPTDPAAPAEPTEPEERESWLEKAGEPAVQLRCTSESLVAVFPDGVTRNLRFEAITGMQVTKEDSDSDEIFFCTVTYVYRQGQNTEVEKTYTFCINPRIGESVS